MKRLKSFDDIITESKISYKRKYTESYPAKVAYSNNKIKSKILETIADGKITKEEFNKIIQELDANKRWVSRNSHLFNINEDGISLSKTGKKLYDRSKLSNNVNKDDKKIINEKSTSISQQRLMGQAYALKKGKIKISEINPEYRDKIKKIADGISGKKLKDFASTKHKDKEGNKLPVKASESYIPSFDKFIYESKMIEHTKNELKLAGMFEDEDSTINNYNKAIANAVVELMTTFSKQRHSGISASMVRDIFNKLSNWETLTPVTSDTNEWVDVVEMGGDKPGELWQNKRNPAIFSKDNGKTWYNVDESILGYVESIIESIMLNPGMNVVGMGPVKFPGNAGTTTAFHGQNIGSGDVPMFIIDPSDKKDDEEDELKRVKKKKKDIQDKDNKK